MTNLPHAPAIIVAQQIKGMAVDRYRTGQAIEKFGTVKRNRGPDKERHAEAGQMSVHALARRGILPDPPTLQIRKPSVCSLRTLLAGSYWPYCCAMCADGSL